MVLKNCTQSSLPVILFKVPKVSRGFYEYTFKKLVKLTSCFFLNCARFLNFRFKIKAAHLFFCITTLAAWLQNNNFKNECYILESDICIYKLYIQIFKKCMESYNTLKKIKYLYNYNRITFVLFQKQESLIYNIIVITKGQNLVLMLV